jgi:hypothetical protein
VSTVVVAPLYSANALPYVSRVRVKAKLGRTNYVVAVDRVVAVPSPIYA